MQSYKRIYATTFNIKNINDVIKEETKAYFSSEKNADEMCDDACEFPYTYDYESEIWFLQGKEKKMFLNHFKEYFIYSNDEEEYNEHKSEFNSFFKIAEEYARQYIHNNYEEWYEEWCSESDSESDEE
jgi:hypothetical protein